MSGENMKSILDDVDRIMPLMESGYWDSSDLEDLNALKRVLQFVKVVKDNSRTPPSGGEEIGEDELINVIIDNIELKGGSINVPRAARAIIEYYRKEQP
jgi:hypothetical protein